MERNDISLYSMLRKRNGYDDESSSILKSNNNQINSNVPAVQTSSREQLLESILDNTTHSKELLTSLEAYNKSSLEEQQEYQRVEALIKDVLQSSLEKLLVPSAQREKNNDALELISNHNGGEAEENILDYDYEFKVMMEKEQKRLEGEQRKAKDLAEVKKLSTKLKNLQKNFEKLQPAIEEKIDKAKKRIETSIKLIWPKEIKAFIQQREKEMRSEIEKKFENIRSVAEAELEVDDLSIEGSPSRRAVRNDSFKLLANQHDDEEVSSHSSSDLSRNDRDQSSKSNGAKNLKKDTKNTGQESLQGKASVKDLAAVRQISAEKSDPDYQPFEPIDEIEEDVSHSKSSVHVGSRVETKLKETPSMDLSQYPISMMGEIEEERTHGQGQNRKLESNKSEDEPSMKKKRGRPKKNAENSAGKSKTGEISQESSTNQTAKKGKKTFKEAGFAESEINEEKSKPGEGSMGKKQKKVKKTDDARNQL